jgi:predicted PhzF superfamily epimerase YddE/YHI9
VVTHAQQPDQMRRVGYLTAATENNLQGQATLAAFRQELNRLALLWQITHAATRRKSIFCSAGTVVVAVAQ